MKVAGQKNNGAWFRANKFIRKLGSEEKDALGQKIASLDTYQDFVTAINDIATQTGQGAIEHIADVSTRYASVGIPLEVWLGKLSWDTYTKNEDGDYLPDHADEVRLFSNDLRTAVTRFRMGRRTVKDVRNLVGARSGNPSGVADAKKDNPEETGL